MNTNEVTISQARYAELVVAEQDAKRLFEIIANKANNYHSLENKELRILRDLFIPSKEEEE